MCLNPMKATYILHAAFHFPFLLKSTFFFHQNLNYLPSSHCQILFVIAFILIYDLEVCLLFLMIIQVYILILGFPFELFVSIKSFSLAILLYVLFFILISLEVINLSFYVNCLHHLFLKRHLLVLNLPIFHCHRY